jgi:hypothetical protein
LKNVDVKLDSGLNLSMQVLLSLYINMLLKIWNVLMVVVLVNIMLLDSHL